MKKQKVILAISILLLLAVIITVFLLRESSIEVNNTTPAEELVSKHYDIEKELLAKAIFYVRDGFEDVNARDLAKEVGMKLECKRQISDTQFYYLILGYYRCFIIVDEKDIVQEVLTVRDFPTIEQTQEWLNRDDPYFDGSILETGEYEFCDLYRDIGGTSRIINTLFTLQDGAMIMEWGGDPEKARYTFYTDEEWRQAYLDWYGAFVILPIDKQKYRPAP